MPTKPASLNPNWMHEPLAIIGMACRLPGADNLAEFWQLLQTGSHGIARFPDEFVDRGLYLTEQKGSRGQSYSDVGGLISPRAIDWSIMPIAASTGDNYDPCHLILCEVATRACLQAGYDAKRLHSQRAGVYVGHSGGSTCGGEIAYRTLLSDYASVLDDLPAWQELPRDIRRQVQLDLQNRLRDGRPARKPDGGPTVDASCAASLISQAFELSGPHMSIDAACASSLVALALSANALAAGRIDMAIVGGASYNKFDSLILFSQAQSCSANGASRPFDAEADGLISSEGYVVFVIKTLARARADGDPIAAVIRGIGLSSDGRGRSLWAPRKEGQATAIERAYSDRITADSVQMVEAHATSTQVGDATEMEALAGFFKARLSGNQRIPVGSVKSNIGHTLETAGLAGLLKAILSIQQGVIPPSINVQRLSESIDWPNIPLYVPRTCESWPRLPDGQPRRAAVNAFGIGGLNVHVIVDQYLTATHKTTESKSSHGTTVRSVESSTQPQPIAVIGRGVVLPGALDVQAFARLISSGISPIGAPPASRWRRLMEANLPADKLEVVGGYITDYHYDWRRHKVPPKQIAQANPLQFMLLEAAEQALREAGYLDRAWDKQHTAVIVGSIFGGDFGNALYAGLRLPEFKRELTRLLSISTTPAKAEAIVRQYEEQFLKQYPALLDETGSFTSSTLASRLSKTFDLMGGAMAIDAADASGLAALDAAVGLLRSGAVNQVLCATGQSAMDRASFERLALSGKLVDRNQYLTAAEPERRELSASIPAEGVALVLLKRLSDAQADGDRILATIHDVTAMRGHEHNQSWPWQSVGAASNSKARQTIGSLQGAQGVVEVIEQSLQPNATQPVHVISQTTAAGIRYLAAVEAGRPKVVVTAPVVSIASDSFVFRLSAPERSSLIELAERVANSTWSEARQFSLPRFERNDQWRAALVVGPDDYRSKSKLLSAQVGQLASLVPLAEQGVMWSEPRMRSGKVAWLFPGQGSQYPFMLRDLVTSNSLARATLDECNQALAELNQPAFEQIAWCDDSQLGDNVWYTQAAMLIADYVTFKLLKSSGFAADVVAGHSFGEFSAMIAGGCWDLRGALQATWHRCQSIMQHAADTCGMLSLQATATEVERLIDASQLPIAISHRNAPEQTVVGGRHADVLQFVQMVQREGISHRLLAVPTAFHTRLLVGAQGPFASALAKIAIQPPRTPLLSSVTGQYVADPILIRQNLAAQLVTPLDFVAMTERLIADDVRVVIEVGPQQILTRLVRQIAGSRLLMLSTDHGKRGQTDQLLVAQAGLEVYCGADMNSSLVQATTSLTKHTASLESVSYMEPLHFDATAARRQRMRNNAQNTTPAASNQPQPVLQFDASQTRRQRNRTQPAVSEAFASAPLPPETVIAAPASDVPKATISGMGDTKPAAFSSRSAIETFLIDFVVEQTGYPAEIIELDWDIEADLGIDSIKKAQLFGELREFFELESLTSFSLDSFRSLRDIVDLLVTVPGKGEWLSTTNSPVDSLPAQVESALPAAASTILEPPSRHEPESRSSTGSTPAVVSAMDNEPQGGTNFRPEQLEQILVDFVVEQTGYPPEIVELDADMEADLGIDSIKKAQLFGELREMFAFPMTETGPAQRLSLSDFKTLRDIKDWLISAIPQSLAPASLSASVSAKPIAEAIAAPTTEVSHWIDHPKSSEPLMASDRPSHEFRKLLPLRISHSQFVGRGQLPWAVFHNDEVASSQNPLEVSPSYISATIANLQAMTGRPSRAENEQQVHYNGQRPAVHAAALRLAQATGTADVSLMAFDSCMLAQAHWQYGIAGTHAQSVANATLRVVAEYHVPAWLLTSGVPLGMHLQQTDSGLVVRWLAPGCVTSMVTMNPNGLLFCGGVLSPVQPAPEPSAALQLSTWLYDQSERVDQAIAFEQAARKLRLTGDWWAMCVDTQTAQRTLMECRDGVIVIEKGILPNANAMVGDEQSAAQLLLDIDNRQLIVRTRSRPKLFAWDEMPLAIDDLHWPTPETSHEDALSSTLSEPPTVTQQVLNTPTVSAMEQPVVSTNVVTPSITKRFVLRMVPSPQRPIAGRRPTWSGTALIIGDNPVATQLEARLRNAQVPVMRWVGSDDPLELARRFDEVVKQQSIRHLFLTTPCDTQSRSSLDRSAWQQRRNVGLMSLYWLCQRWHQHVCASGWVDDASLVAVTTLGGDFGLQSKVPSIEGGALSGLLKSILIESWVQGFRTFPIKVIDTCCQDSPAQIANNIWHELSIPSFDIEVAYCQGERHVVRAIAKPLETSSGSSLRWPITNGGTWICTGGARGITAFVAEKLALTYGLKLHLLGTQPLPQINESWRHLDDAGLRELKAQVMTSARTAGKNPVTTWQDTEKALEIDRNLRRFMELGIHAHYHSCDVTDREAVARTLEQIRRLSGPIHGVLHGAGIGKDARFDRKQPEKVNQCIGAKVDGAWSLIEATWNDPLEAFVGFGSISGRFGANGHTDYSLANDMLCKQMDWLRSARPEVHAIGFHWHAWGDIGMATKPETKLALEMIDMQFMPALEGVQHLLRELAGDSEDSEVLITDDRYYRLFYEPELLVDASGRSLAHLPPPTPLIQSEPQPGSGQERLHVAQLNPAKDPFLAEHRLDDKPLLPIVIGTELMLEAARAHLGHMQPLKLCNVRAHQGLRFYTDASQAVRVATSIVHEPGQVACRLMSDFHARDGRLVDRDRVNMTGEVVLAGAPTSLTRLNMPTNISWQRPTYPVAGSKFYVGLPLQRLRGFAFVDDGLVGRINAPALIELAGGRREVRGWQLPSAAVDACLFATGILAWQTVAPGSALPAGFGEIELGRAPWAGEICQVHVRLREASVGKAAFDFTLYGINQDMLVNVRNYQIAWLAEPNAASLATSTSVAR